MLMGGSKVEGEGLAVVPSFCFSCKISLSKFNFFTSKNYPELNQKTTYR